jgi:hypothetical protein
MLTSVRIGIMAPDAATAFVLEKRLSHLRPTSIGRHEGWVVELDDDQDRYDEIVAAVRHWLREIGLAATEVHVDGRVERVEQVESPVLVLIHEL